jgi:leader peptidase (prepilin peptidase)/N-methyltransferase
MAPLVLAGAFVFGAVVGSFLNMLIWRLPREESIVFPPSHCPKCNAQLRPLDLIPILSYLMLKGRCRYCGERIEPRYLIVELAASTLSLLLVYRFLIYDYQPYLLLLYLPFTYALIAIFFIDLQHYIIPDQLSFFTIGWGILMNGIMIWQKEDELMWGFLPPAIFSALAMALLVMLIDLIGRKIFKKESMGGGDVMLAGGMGACLGWKNALVAFFLAVFVGAIWGIGLIVGKKKEWGTYIPFGPFLVIGSIGAIFFASQLIDLYLTLAGFK